MILRYKTSRVLDFFCKAVISAELKWTTKWPLFPQELTPKFSGASANLKTAPIPKRQNRPIFGRNSGRDFFLRRRFIRSERNYSSPNDASSRAANLFDSWRAATERDSSARRARRWKDSSLQKLGGRNRRQYDFCFDAGARFGRQRRLREKYSATF